MQENPDIGNNIKLLTLKIIVNQIAQAGSGVIYKSRQQKEHIYIFTAKHCLCGVDLEFSPKVSDLLFEYFNVSTRVYCKFKVSRCSLLFSAKNDSDIAIIVIPINELPFQIEIIPSVNLIANPNGIRYSSIFGFPIGSPDNSLERIDTILQLPTENETWKAEPKRLLEAEEHSSTLSSTKGFSGSGFYLNTLKELYLFGIVTDFIEWNRFLGVKISLINTLLITHNLPSEPFVLIGPIDAKDTRSDSIFTNIFRKKKLRRDKRKIYHNIRNEKYFIGRKKKIDLIKTNLRETNEIIKIIGRSGVGKSALALEVIIGILKENKATIVGSQKYAFKALIWITAKYNDISFKEFLNRILMTLELNHLIKLNNKEKENEILKILQKIKALIVFDNYESLHKDKEIISRFLCKVPEPTRLIITSRYNNFNEGINVMLDELSPSECIAFIRKEAERHDLPALKGASDDVLLDLHEATGGLPLAIEWSIGQIKSKGVNFEKVISELMNGKGDIFQYLFEKSWMSLNDKAKEILKYLSVFKSSVPRSLLENIFKGEEKEFRKGLGQLVEMLLIDILQFESSDPNDMRYSLHPLTISFAKSKIENLEKINSYHQSVAKYYVNFTKNRNPSLVNSDRVKEINLELDNILFVLSWCSSSKKFSLVKDLTFNLEEYLLISGFWDERINYGKDAILACSEIDDKENMSHFLTIVGGTLALKGKYGDAEKLLNDALINSREIGSDSQTSRALRTMSVSAYRQGKVKKAEELINGVAELALRSGDVLNYIDTLWVMGMLSFEKGDYRLSRSIFIKMTKKAKEVNWVRSIAYALEFISKINIIEKKYQLSLNAINEGISIATEFKDQRQIAKLLLQKSKLYLLLGRGKSSSELAHRAMTIFEKLGMYEQAKEAKEILNRSFSFKSIFNRVKYFHIAQ